MKVVALVSGGKDSTFNMMLCAAYGHEIVAMANLHPPDSGGELTDKGGASADGGDGALASEEMDSFMYQTAGHTLIPLLAECAGLPLFRQPIRGSAVQTGLEYAAPAAPAVEPDEVEDLLLLLQAVLEAHPDVRGVSVGAIASDYQRVRVESVCARLGLTALAYLWRQEQAALLDRMIAAGVDAVLCKVACLGLSPRAHLGRSLAEVRPKLHELNASFGCHVCGEGGEYESMTLWCPLFPARMQLSRTSAHVLDEGGGFAPVAVLRVGEARAVPVSEAERAGWPPLERAPAAPLLAPAPCESAGAGGGAGGDGGEAPVPAPAWAAAERSAAHDGADEVAVRAHAVGCWLSVGVSVPLGAIAGSAGASAAAAAADADAAAGSEAEGPERAAAAISAALHAAEVELHARGSAGLSDALLLKLFLSDMSHYPAVNKAFAAALAGCAPAARAAVAVPLSLVGAVLRLEVLARRRAAPRRASPGASSAAEPPLPPAHPPAPLAAALPLVHKGVLHVQSISEWAPRMIGPYAQAAWVADTRARESAQAAEAEADGGASPTLCCVAGSLGLHPALMSLVPGGAAHQAAQALANVDSVLDALGRSAGDALSATLFTALGAEASSQRADGRGCGEAARQMHAWSCAPGASAAARGRPPPLRATLRVDALPMGALAEALVDTLGRDAGGAGAGEVRCAGLPPADWQWRESEERYALTSDAAGAGAPGEAAEGVQAGDGRPELVVRALWRESAGGARSASLGLAQLWAYVVWVGGSAPSAPTAAAPRARRLPLALVLPAVSRVVDRLCLARGAGAPLLSPLHVSVAYAQALGPGAEDEMSGQSPLAGWPASAAAAGVPSLAFVPVREIVEPADCCAVVSVLLACAHDEH